MSNSDKFMHLVNRTNALISGVTLPPSNITSGAGERLCEAIACAKKDLTSMEKKVHCRKRTGNVDFESDTAGSPALGKRMIVGYIRTDLGSDEIARQRNDMRAYVWAKYRRRLDTFYVDERRPAPGMHGPGIRRLVKAANAGLIDVVLVTDAGRIVHNRILRDSVDRVGKPLDIEIYSSTNGHVATLSDPADRLITYRHKSSHLVPRAYDRARNRAAMNAARTPITQQR